VQYELINPSDPIFFDAPDVKIATLACIYVSNGHYGAHPQDGGDPVPVLIFGWRKWWDEKYNTNPEEDVKANAAAIVATLRSFRLQDGRERSSMNDICANAHKDAEALEKLYS